MAAKFRASPLALAVLALLNVGPLHPYGVQRLIKQWGKDDVINVGQRANLYKTIKRLVDADLIAVHQTERDQQYPERTVYVLTDTGRQTALEWLSSMLGTPKDEFPEFPAALSFIMLMDPVEVLSALEQRSAILQANLKRRAVELEALGGELPRVTLLDDEYQQAVISAEVNWLRGVIDDLRSGALTWTDELFEQARSYLSD